jgi:predicted PolB exonuclease-like 3'-5' exonuclease
MKKQDTIDKWYAEEAPALAKELYRKRALDSMQGSIFCIGWSFDCGEYIACNQDERDTLLEFESFVEGVMGDYKQIPTYVGWNIKSFDLSWLWRKAIKYDLKTLRQSINRDRYKGNAIDLMEVWAADFKDYRKQSDVAKFLGLPDLSNGIDGSKVYDMICDGKIEEVKNYCLGDVLTSKAIYEKIYG